MNSLPPTISILFERQPAPTLRQRLRDAYQAGDTALFDGAVAWKLEAFEDERIWEGTAASFDAMVAEIITTLGDRQDDAVQLVIEEARNQ